MAAPFELSARGMVVAAGSRKPAPLEPVQCTSKACSARQRRGSLRVSFFISPTGSLPLREPVGSVRSTRGFHYLRSLGGRTVPWALVDGNGCSLSRACRLFSLGYGL